MKEKTSFL